MGITVYCQWCDRAAVETIELEPARMGTITEGGQKRHCVVRAAITAPACRDHLSIRDRKPGARMVDKRTRPARNAEQMDLFG